MDRFDRIFQLNKLFTNRHAPVSLKEIMVKLECSQATAERDIQELRNFLNAPLEYDRKHNGYYYNQSGDKPYELPGLWFSTEELNGLLICQQILQNISPGLLSEQITALRKRIESLFNIKHAPCPTDISQKVSFHTLGRRLKDDCEFKKIATALFNNQQLTIHYSPRSDNANSGERIVSPQQLNFYRDNWYLIAFCHLRNELRLFAVDKIITAKILKTTAKQIDEQQVKQFLGSSYGIFSGNAEHIAVLEFSPTKAKWVADEIWHEQQLGKWLTNGSYQLSFPFNDSRELIMDILKHGNEVEVIAPEFLREAVKEQIFLMQKIYEK